MSIETMTSLTVSLPRVSYERVRELIDADYTADKALVGLCSANIALFIGMKLFYMWRNSVKKARFAALSPEERLYAVDQQYVH